MKKYISVLSLAVLSVMSCSLNERSIDFTMKEDFYKSDNDLIMGVNACYNVLATEKYYGNQFTSALFCSADYGEGNTGQNSVQQFTRAELTGEHIILKNIWAEIYKGIARANSVIYYAGIATDVTPELQSRVIGEAKFLRALHYYNLVQCFGEVPLRLKPILDFEKEEKLALSSKEDILEQIISDLEFAEDNCWNRGESRDGFVNDIGRATSLAATSLLAKVYLYIASVGRIAADPTFLDGGFPGIHSEFDVYKDDYKEYYRLCKETCEKGIAHKDFDMEKDWAKLWNVAQNKNPKEYIFAVQYSSETGYGNKLPFLFLPRQSVLGGSRNTQGGVNRFVQQFVNMRTLDTDNEYRWQNGFVLNLEYRDGSKAEEWRWKDGKGSYFIASTGALGKGGGKNRLSVRKWNDPATGSESSSSCDLPLIRSVDLYLMLAEAKVELSQNPSDGYADLNTARERLTAPEINDTYLASFTGDSQMEKFRNLILRERLQEFAAENDRFYTLKRMGRYITECKKVVAVGGGAKVRTVEDYYWPVSQDEIEANLGSSDN